MTAPKITDHAWRIFPVSIRPHGVPESACGFMNCRRPPEEHERSRGYVRDVFGSREADRP